MYDKDYIKKHLDIEQIMSLVEEFGGNPTLHGQMFIAETICHNIPGEGSKKLYYYDNTKLFNCYTDCGSFDIFELIVKIYEVQYNETIELPKALAYVANKFGFSEGEEDNGFNNELKDWEILRRIENKKNAELTNGTLELKEYDEKILTVFAKPIIQPWIDEGISRATMDRFEISYYPKDCQIVIPHRDINNRLVGIRGRTLVKEDGELYGKYRPIIVNSIMYNHSLGFSLYGLNFNKENIRTIKKAIIFEGEKSVMLYDSYFGSENNIAVACCGSSISKIQINLLLELGVQEIVIAFDRQFKEIGDDEFRKHTNNIRKTADKYKNYVTISCIFDKKNYLNYKSSPIDQGKETFLKMFQERILL